MSFISAVQHERGPRNSTIRRQVAMYLKESSEYNAMMMHSAYRPPYLPGCLGIEPIPEHIVAYSPSEPPSPVTPGSICQPTPKVNMIKTYYFVMKSLFR